MDIKILKFIKFRERLLYTRCTLFISFMVTLQAFFILNYISTGCKKFFDFLVLYDSLLS